ncbi:disease resistance protein RGA4-like [Aegilops tauschii subsp. strangulata]|uniref:Disease resistance protein RPM1 n=2 Tax=Aegilops tauschii subsp. strangulata TaxID=200361 RepID=A0A453QA40_AEGTS|nr:disease resistance protein RGA4-like [Aegilops tauschii subsp. strangulata]
MEVVATAAATSFVEWMVPKLFDFLDKNHELRKNLERDIKFIQNEFAMISAVIQDEQKVRHDGGEEVHKEWIKMVREVAHAIEDCIDRFMHRVRMPETGAGWLRHAVHRVKTVKARNEFAVAIQELKKISEDASKLKVTYSSSITSSPGRSMLSEQTETAMTKEDDGDDDHSAASGPVPVGMGGPRNELLDMIQQQQQLKVITIVGFHGMGKTLLANHVYKAVESQYEARVWVPPAKLEGRATDVLKEILRQLGQCVDGRLTKLQASVKECIGTKRFFIVIDDLRKPGYWHDVKVAFAGLSGRFLVTTAIQRVANTCSSSIVHDHVYTMATLADEHSRLLFFNEAFQDDDLPPNAEELGSAALKKCDGLPLALVTTARFLQSAGNPTTIKWAKLCADMGTNLESDELFERMRRVLVQSYTSLDTQVARTFLLYLSTYPSGRPIRKSSLLRRWLAEGLCPGDNARTALDTAINNFNKLVDRSIIQPMDASGRSTEVKTCHTHGMMLEFVLRKSMAENFVTVLYDQQSTPHLPSNIRRLALHGARPSEVQGLTLVRSLTILGKAHRSVLDFSKYQLLRVLDLEECVEPLRDSHLKLICRKLFLLRYLCLGKAVIAMALPKEISKLRLLDTLDVRNTPIEILQAHVLELPCLVHLFGRFKLKQDVGDRRMSKLQTWLSVKSKLETLAGFVVDNRKSQEFAQLMYNMNDLTKVKIWCEPTADTSCSSHLSKAIKGFIERSSVFRGTPSLSLSFEGELTQDMLNFSLEKVNNNCCYLGSLKLQGSKICSLPSFVAFLGGLTKLGLSSPQLSLSEDFLAALSKVPGLAHLKLVATILGKLVITEGMLKRLSRLSIVVESTIDQLEIKEGALPCLKSLQLLCKYLDGFSGISPIKYIKNVEEIALHHEVSDETKHEWTEAAKKLPNPRPKILFL